MSACTNAAATLERQAQAGEYLELLGSLAGEIERAMHAIAHNSLSDLEESVSNQQILTSTIVVLTGKLSVPLQTPSDAVPATGHAGLRAQGLRAQIDAAMERLQNLNRSYAALLQHSSRSVALMASLFASFQGQIQEASGTRVKYQTWSCRM